LYPDYTILFDINPEIAYERRQNRENVVLDNFEKKSIDFHKDVRNGYLEIAEKNQKKGHKYFIIDSDNTMANIQKQIDDIINILINSPK
jgi:thymidylate kinase